MNSVEQVKTKKWYMVLGCVSGVILWKSGVSLMDLLIASKHSGSFSQSEASKYSSYYGYIAFAGFLGGYYLTVKAAKRHILWGILTMLGISVLGFTLFVAKIHSETKNAPVAPGDVEALLNGNPGEYGRIARLSGSDQPRPTLQSKTASSPSGLINVNYKESGSKDSSEDLGQDRVRVRRKSDGTTGTMPRSNFNADKYEII